jgi:two-component system nitrogen regulation response regulator GlnG/two-component system response regulator HydG
VPAPCCLLAHVRGVSYILARVPGNETLDIDDVDPSELRDAPSGESTHVLVLAWAAALPARVGEVLTVKGDAPLVFGRGEATPEDGGRRALLRRSRPGVAPDAVGEPFEDPFLSRRQLELAKHETGIHVVNVGKRPILVDNQPVTQAVVRAGETLEIKGRLLFVCVSRAASIAELRNVKKPHAFGEPDEFGYVGESVAAWSLRDRLAFVARRAGHVLLHGESGSGKELAARAVHGLSDRAPKKLVARNAATFPAGLIDAELFGNVANYPNAGMAERPGVIGEADGSTLFLDEIGELPENLQTHLLRVLDDDGDYQRLGDSKRRRANLRLVAATNRPVEHLKHDLAARLRLRLDVPGLNDRAGDIPLILRHLLRRAAARDHEIGERFLEAWNGHSGEPRLSLDLARALVTHRYATHVRELDMLLWSSLASSSGNVAELTDAVRRDLGIGSARTAPSSPPTPAASPASARPPANEVTEEQLRASLAKHEGVKERVWRELGLPSRFALRRLLLKYRIEGEEGGEA